MHGCIFEHCFRSYAGWPSGPRRRVLALVLALPLMLAAFVSPTRAATSALASLSLCSTTVVGGTVVTGTVALTAPASQAVTVTLSSSNMAAATAPASVNIAASGSSATFSLTSKAVTTSTSATITGTLSGASKSASLLVKPPSPVSLTFNPTTVQGGWPTTGTVMLSGPAPTGGLIVALSSANPAVLISPATMKVPAGATGGPFNVNTNFVFQATKVAVTAAVTAGSASGTLMLASPTRAATPALASISLSPATVIGGTVVTGTVALTATASQAVTVALSSSKTAAATVPASVKVAAGGSSATFKVTSKAVTTSTSVTITGTLSGASKSASLLVKPPSPVSLTFNPTTVQGGWPSMGTVTLSGPAPTGGLIVALSSANPAVLNTPATMKVPAGATGATFNVNTNFVFQATNVVVTATVTAGSASGTLQVQPLSQPTVTLSSSANPSQVGQSVTLTAIVQALTGLPTPTGTVKFLDGATSLGSAVLNSSGQATWTPKLAVGTHSLTASYGGNASYNPATSNTVIQVVYLYATQTALTSSVNPSMAGQTVTFTAIVTSPAGVPAGSVQFMDGAANLGGPVALSKGSAVLATSALAAGTNNFTAVYSGNTSFSSSTSNTVAQISLYPTQTSLASSVDPSVTGQTVTFTAVVASAAGTPAGTIQFMDGTGALGSPVSLDASGQAVVAISTLIAGTHSISAVYSGSAINAPSTSIPLNQVVTSLNPATGLPRNMQVLVVSGDGQDLNLPIITQTLSYMGEPYQVYVEADNPGGLTSSFLGTTTQGNFQAIIVTTNTAALSSAEWTTLAGYEAAFGVRQVTWFEVPTSDDGYLMPATLVDLTGNTTSYSWTSQGAATFPYLNIPNGLNVQGVPAYLAPPAGSSLVPLLTDSSGDALMGVQTYPDGHQVLAVTFDNASYIPHSQVIAYGLVNWATGGLFLGARHVYLSPQIDDLFIPDNLWNPTTDVPDSGTPLRITGSDFTTFLNWQSSQQALPTTSALRCNWPFVGVGTTQPYWDSGTYDSLFNAVMANQTAFNFISHTYDHIGLDGATYSQALYEFTTNIQLAQSLGLSAFSPQNLVTPGISGLTTSATMQAAWDAGVRYVIRNPQMTGLANPTVNAGTYNLLQPGILEIPRNDGGIYDDVSTPAQWLSEFYYYAGPGYSTWQESDLLAMNGDRLVALMYAGDSWPWMFHECEVYAYDGQNSLVTDLLNQVLQMYNYYYALPVVSPTMDVLGARIASRTAYNASGVTATLTPGQSIAITVTNAAPVPVTGLSAANSEIYGAQPISYFTLSAGQTLTIPLQASTGNGAVAASGVTSGPAF